MKQKLLIIGAGNIGGFISYNIADFGDYQILGFLDDDTAKIGKSLYGHPVLASISEIDAYLNEDPIAVVIGIANPIVKQKISHDLERKKVVFPNFISPNVWLSKKTQLGKGIILYPGVSVNYECEISDFVIMNMNCAIGHNCKLDACATLAPGVNLAGFTHVKECADVGIGATTIQGVSIGKQSRIGGQTMVLKDVPDGATAVGNPARIIRESATNM